MKKILIIEDDVDVSMLLKRFLSKNGFEVSTAHSGNKGLAVFEEEKPDLVLCDFRLGDLDGNEVLMRIKKSNYATPVIIITAYSDIKIAVKVIKQGAFDYITKPLFPDEILLTIKRAINSREENPIQPGNNHEETEEVRRPKVNDSYSREEYLIGNSDQSKELYKQIDLVAP